MNLFKILTISLLTISFAFAADEATKLHAADQSLIDKALDSNLTNASKAYAAYLAEVAKAQDKTIKELEAVKAAAMKRGNLALANAADAQIKSVKDGALAERAVDLNKQKGDLLGETGTRQVTIDATTDGQVIANAKKGQTIVLQYVSGTWGDGGSGKGSPDAEATVKTCRMQLVTPSAVVDVPTNTVKSAFKYKVTEDGECTVRMVDTVRKDNTGSVVYTVTVK